MTLDEATQDERSVPGTKLQAEFAGIAATEASRPLHEGNSFNLSS